MTETTSPETVTTVHTMRRKPGTDEKVAGPVHLIFERYNQTWCGRKMSGASTWRRSGQPLASVTCKECLSAHGKSQPVAYRRFR